MNERKHSAKNGRKTVAIFILKGMFVEREEARKPSLLCVNLDSKNSHKYMSEYDIKLHIINYYFCDRNLSIKITTIIVENMTYG